MPLTYTGKDGKQYFTKKEAELAGTSTSSGVYIDRQTGKAYTTERALKEAEYNRAHPYG